MPKLERWEEKVIKRIPRFQNTTSEVIVTKLYDGAKMIAKTLVDGTINKIRSKVDEWFAAPEIQEIDGKEFRENFGITQKVSLKIGAAITETALDKAGDYADAYIYRDYFYPTGKAVAKSTFNGSVTFDREMSRQMYNACGYEPDFKAVLNTMYSTAAKVKPSLTDVTWRKEIVPHMIRTAFQKELKNSFRAIGEYYSGDPMIYNHKFMEAHMNTAAQHLSKIFEKFTLDLANHTDYLEAPMSFLPKQADLHTDIEMKPEERQLLEKASRHSLIEKEGDLQNQISDFVQKMPQAPVIEAFMTFKNGLIKPITNSEGQEVPYQPGIDAAEDARRLINGILNLRGIKHRYESRGFFNRIFSSDARGERKTIQRMKALLHEKTGVSAEDVKILLDSKTPLESNISISEVLSIQPRAKTLSENISDAMEYTGKAITNATGAIMNTLIQTGIAAGNAAGNMIGNMASGAANVVYKTGEYAYGMASSAASGAVDLAYKAGGMVSSAAGSLWSGLKTAASYANPLSYFSSSQQQPVNQENVIEEEPPKGDEEIEANDKPQSEVKVEEQPKIESNPILEQEAEDQARLSILTQMQEKQLALIRALGTDPITSPPLYYGTISKLLYLKTLEISFSDKMIDEKTALEHLSEQSITDGAKKLSKEPAFYTLQVCRGSGIAKRFKTFGKEINDNPSIVNDIHKEYIHNLQKFAQAQEQNDAPSQKDVVKNEPVPKVLP